MNEFTAYMYMKICGNYKSFNEVINTKNLVGSWISYLHLSSAFIV